MRVAIIVTAIVTSDRVRSFVKSVRTFYPDIAIYIGTQGELTPAIDDLRGLVGVELVELPFDCGVCTARNALVVHAREPYLFVCDDDFIFIPETGLVAALSVLDTHPDIWIVGGRLKQFEYHGEEIVGQSEPTAAHNFVYGPDSRTLVKYPTALLRPKSVIHRGHPLFSATWLSTSV